MKEIVVEVVDGIMGGGKTTECFKWIDKNPTEKYIYVSPMLSEVGKNGRIHTSVLGVEFISPDVEETDYKTKTEHLTKLLEDGANICCTHNLYLSMTKEHFSLMEKHNYVVVLDEEIEVIKTYGVYSSSDIQYLIDKKEITIDEKDGAISWIGDNKTVEDYDHKYNKLKNLCDKHSIYLNNGLGAKKNILISHIPLKMLECAKRVIVITYMFKGCVLDCFLKIKGIRTVVCKDIVPTKTLKPSDFKDLITIVPPNKKTKMLKMSYTWWNSLTKEDTKFVNSIANLISNTANQYGITPEDVVWTCPKANAQGLLKEKKIKLNPKGFVRYTDEDGAKHSCWLSVHTRATNDYSHKKLVAHCYNRYPLQAIKTYLITCGAPIDEPRYAISSLLQFTWRSQIRNDKPIVLLIANHRMYEFMIRWLNNEFE
jgi:hypothetical protein